MADWDTFLTTLYVMVDDFCQLQEGLAEGLRTPCGRRPALAPSEVITVGLVSQLQRFRSERDFYRFADQHLRTAFPALPHRAQFNRQLRQHYDLLIAFFRQHLVHLQQQADYDRRCEILDLTAIPSRNAQRRGMGWLPEHARKGWSRRLKYFIGFHLLCAINPSGIITGFGIASGDVKEQPLTEAFLAARQQPQPALACVGAAPAGFYVADTGFEGADWHRHWYHDYNAPVLAFPQSQQRLQWPRALRRWLVHVRQTIESVYEKLHH
jgi:hypothetical protein